MTDLIATQKTSEAAVGHKAGGKHRFARASSAVVAALFVFVMVALVVLAAVSTCFITFDDGPLGNEHTFFVPDSVLVNCIFVLAVIGIAYAVSTRSWFDRFRDRLSDDRFFRRCKIIALVVLALEACLWLASTLAVPGADQGTIQKIVISAQSGDWSAFDADGYMNVFPNQIGYFWISYLFAPLFKSFTSAFMQLFNVAGLVVACESLSALAGRMGASRVQQLVTLIVVIAFYPFVQYCSFVYGILWGLALSLVAIRCEMRFFDTWRWRYAIAAAACITLAMVFKSNYQVFLIAMALYALVELVDVKKLAVLGLVAMLVAGFFVQSYVPAAAAEAASGREVRAGVSSWAWIAMGLQDGQRAPGWYNSYNTVSFHQAGDDTAVQAEAAKENIRTSFAQFASGERDAVVFFTKKVASQWNNPTFQGYWNVQKRRSAYGLLPPMAWLMGAEGEDAAVRFYLNLVQMGILAGALAWAVLARREGERPHRALVLPLVFLGGFGCHLIWEAKCQYALPYFALLVPYCAMGYGQVLSCLENAVGARSRGKHASGRDSEGFLKGRRAALGACAVSAVLVAAIAAAGGYGAVRGDAEAYADWLAGDPVCPLVSVEPYLVEYQDLDAHLEEVT